MLHLSGACRTALQGMLLMARRPGAFHAAHDAAAARGLPADFLSKILPRLARSGLLVSRRGARGGYRLARSADRITVAQVVEALEGRAARRPCAFGCSRSVRCGCSLQAAARRAEESLRRLMSRTRLADLAGRESRRPSAHL